jgi:hypothetical protein
MVELAERAGRITGRHREIVMRILSRALGAVLCAGVLAAASSAHASDSAAGYISEIIPFGDAGVILFNHDGVRSASPACGAGLATRWAFSAAGAGGQARLSALLSAYALRKKIYIVGAGTCGLWADTETLNYFVIKD